MTINGWNGGRVGHLFTVAQTMDVLRTGWQLKHARDGLQAALDGIAKAEATLTNSQEVKP